MKLFILLVFALACLDSASSYFIIGTNATMMCSWPTLKEPSLIEKVRWYRKGKKLRENKKYHIAQTGLNYTLTIHGIKTTDKGNYTCSPKTIIHMITVNDKLITIDVKQANLPKPQPQSNVTLYAGGGGQLRCNLASVKEKLMLKFFWERNGEKLMEIKGEAGYYKINNRIPTRFHSYVDSYGNDVLKIEDVEEEAGGVYTCNYKYPDGQIFSMYSAVEVIVPKGPDDVQRDISWGSNVANATLKCDLSGLGGIDYRFYWEKDGIDLTINPDDTKYKISEEESKYILEIIGVGTADAGIYRCVAQLKYYPVAVRFNVVVKADTRDVDFTAWTAYSTCDKAGTMFRFRTCTAEDCMKTYGYVYEVDQQTCDSTS